MKDLITAIVQALVDQPDQVSVAEIVGGSKMGSGQVKFLNIN
jgi:predicted RNA-binding protein YlqC (UPF0109 family)